MKKSGKLICQVVNSNTAIGSVPTLKIPLGTVTSFEKIYNGEQILAHCQKRKNNNMPLRHYYNK
jgi:hypothetical protein